jgi:thioredoxin 1
MRDRLLKNIALWLLIGSVLVGGALPSWAEPGMEVPVKGMVTLVDLGANACIPCRMMAPIMTKLEKDYQGKAAIIFIDVWKDKGPADRFGIQAIPTQIFFDKTGKEVLRHLGFMSEKEIVSQLKKMGVK